MGWGEYIVDEHLENTVGCSLAATVTLTVKPVVGSIG